MPEQVEIAIGSQWADNYPGNEGRMICVDDVDERYVHGTVQTNPTAVQQSLDRGDTRARDVRGRATRILRREFSTRPRQRGYRPATPGDISHHQPGDGHPCTPLEDTR